MAKHRVPWTSRTYHRRLKEGRGSGTLQDYKPWITIHDIASKGFVSRVMGLTTGRIHHLLSRNETAFFFILDASEKVKDIREQFPLLDVKETVAIAERAGIRHPRDPQSRYPYVLTSDFVITTENGICVRSVKGSAELSKQRVREKLEIERRYWTERGADWKIVTEEQIDYQKARNLEWIRKSETLPDMLPEGVSLEEILACFLDLYRKTCLPVCDVACLTEENFGLESGTGLLIFQYLIMKKVVTADLSLPMDLVSVRKENDKELMSWIQAYV